MPQRGRGLLLSKSTALPASRTPLKSRHAEDKEGEEEAIVIHDLGGLINLVQASVLEIHPWGARIEDVEHPDRLIFDLDPGEGSEWGAVIEAARDVRRRLQDLGLRKLRENLRRQGLARRFAA